MIYYYISSVVVKKMHINSVSTDSHP